jgi:hypothetical protein
MIQQLRNLDYRIGPLNRQTKPVVSAMIFDPVVLVVFSGISNYYSGHQSYKSHYPRHFMELRLPLAAPKDDVLGQIQFVRETFGLKS